MCSGATRLLRRDIESSLMSRGLALLPPAARPPDTRPFEELDHDSLSYVLSFLDARSLASFGTTCRGFHELARASYLWFSLCLKAWGLPASTPLAAVDGRYGTKGALASLYPHIISWPRELFNVGSSRAPQTFRVVNNRTVQFTGGVPGAGNRSIRSSVPFPPLVDSQPTPTCETVWAQMTRLMDCLLVPPNTACRRVGQCTEQKEGGKPMFSVPWTRRDGRLAVEPRTVAYYEVAIQPLEQRSLVMNNNDQNNNSCVAIGLAEGNFPLEGMMPGWSATSYALHSDDGAIFHAAGIKLRYFSKSFGAGDTVGCGIDYDHREIFYTLNGEFLGVAFKDVKGTLFPTVGIDTRAPIEINFGDRPFAFSLDEYKGRRDEWVAQMDRAVEE